MGLRFTVLASGSAGNASLVEAGGFGLLLDAGLGPRQLAARLAAVGSSWQDVSAVVLTHTHSDHWSDRTLAHLHRRGLPLYCHPGHRDALAMYSSAFRALAAAGLVHDYEAGQELMLSPGLRCRPLPVRHDGGPTFGFRLEAAPDLFGSALTLAYLADLGCWDAGLVAAVADADILALEFNHDVAMQHASGRHPRLIARVLGNDGHLSNAQAAALLREVLGQSAAGRVQHVVQLHLSRECNRPGLAAAAANEVVAELGRAITVHTASQDVPGPRLHLGLAAGGGARRRYVPARRRGVAPAHPWLPGLENG
jgi:phosphoribosyl 1,2-cyclic phosphodiesterase